MQRIAAIEKLNKTELPQPDSSQEEKEFNRSLHKTLIASFHEVVVMTFKDEPMEVKSEEMGKHQHNLVKSFCKIFKTDLYFDGLLPNLAKTVLHLIKSSDSQETKI